MDPQPEPKRKRRGVVILAALLGLIAIVFAWALLQGPEKNYKFVTADHPVDMWGDDGGQWAYFFCEGSFADSFDLVSALRIRSCDYLWKPMRAIPVGEFLRND